MKARAVLVCILPMFIACVSPSYSGMELLAGLAPCEPIPRTKDAIIGGQLVSLGDPDQNLVTKLLIQRSEGDSICTGTLISDHVILTAAHCVEAAAPEEVEAHFLTSEGCPVDHRKSIRIKMNRLVIHKDFDRTPQSLSDLALIYLEKKAPSDQQRIVPIKNGERPSSDQVLFIGFGITGEDRKDSQALRRVYKSHSTDLHPRPRSVVVDQRDRAGFCRGDSGAPILGEVFGETRILAVNSANVGKKTGNECHELSLAMDASFFSDWIDRNRRSLENSTWFERQLSSAVQRQ